MIVGIDESGDFSLGSTRLWVAVFIRPSELEAVTTAHRSWERAVRRDLGLSNEIKGSSVDDKWLGEFVRSVMHNPAGTPLRYRATAIQASRENLDQMPDQRRRLVDGYKRAARQFASLSPDDQSAANEALNHAAWVGALTDAELLKLVGLGRVISESVPWAMGWSCAGGWDLELGDLSVQVDSGYVSKSRLPFWNDLLRNAFRHASAETPLVFLDTWTDGHPFVARFVEQHGDEQGVVLTPAFPGAIEFVDSLRSPAVRIADVVASAVRRATVQRQDLRSYEALQRLHWRPRTPYTELRWGSPPTQ